MMRSKYQLIAVMPMLLSTSSLGMSAAVTQTSPTSAVVVLSGDVKSNFVQSGNGWWGSTSPNSMRVFVRIQEKWWQSDVRPMSGWNPYVTTPWTGVFGNPGYPPDTTIPNGVLFWERFERNAMNIPISLSPGMDQSDACQGWGVLPYPTVCVRLSHPADGTKYRWLWRADMTAPPLPASCTATKFSDIDFGSIDAKQVNGAEAKGAVVVQCDKKATVRAKFLAKNGTDQLQLDNGLTAYLKIDGQPGATGVTSEVNTGRGFNVSATLVDVYGQAQPGKFSGSAVMRVEVQ